MLRVWAARDNRILYPLEGVSLLTLPDVEPAGTVPPGRPAVRPQDFPPLERRRIQVGEGGGLLHRCPGNDCAVLGHVDSGEHDAMLLDHRGRWTLLVVGDEAGWLADDLFVLPPLKNPGSGAR